MKFPTFPVAPIRFESVWNSSICFLVTSVWIHYKRTSRATICSRQSAACTCVCILPCRRLFSVVGLPRNRGEKWIKASLAQSTKRIRSDHVLSPASSWERRRRRTTTTSLVFCGRDDGCKWFVYFLSHCRRFVFPPTHIRQPPKTFLLLQVNISVGLHASQIVSHHGRLLVFLDRWEGGRLSNSSAFC